MKGWRGGQKRLNPLHGQTGQEAIPMSSLRTKVVMVLEVERGQFHGETGQDISIYDLTCIG